MSFCDYNDFYQEPSEFDEKIEELKSYLMDSVKQDTKEDLKHYKKSAEKCKKESTELKIKVKSLEIENKRLCETNDFSEILLQRITKKNIEHIISDLFEQTFHENTYDCPLHWGLYVNYYNNREHVLKILRFVGIEVPYDSSVVLPHEWDTQTLDKFFDEMNSHANCNNQVFEENLRFWSYQRAKDPFTHPSYSQIPWQFVLRNPLLNSEDYALRIAQEINKGGNGYKFCKIEEYQKLDDNVIQKIVENTLLNKQYLKSEVNQFIANHIEYVKDDEELSAIIKVLSSMRKAYDMAVKLPEKYQIEYAKMLSINDKVEFFKKSTLSQENKAKIFCETV